MLSKTMETALNEQIREEMYSSYLYLSMSAYFEGLNLKGMARWMRIQFKEEQAHALKLFDFIHDRGGAVALRTIDQPQATWTSPAAAFAATYQHEQHITACINKLVDAAQAERDHATVGILQWFVKEQVEEEAHVEPIVRRLEVAGDNPAVLFFTDRELGARAD